VGRREKLGKEVGDRHPWA